MANVDADSSVLVDAAVADLSRFSSVAVATISEAPPPFIPRSLTEDFAAPGSDHLGQGQSTITASGSVRPNTVAQQAAAEFGPRRRSSRNAKTPTIENRAIWMLIHRIVTATAFMVFAP
jgi:hypothetical protein